ncbi:hypothetical protein [Methylobacterium sp. Gmos1]
MTALPLILGVAAALALAHVEIGSIARTGSAESTLAWAIIGHTARLATLAFAVFLMGLVMLRRRS